MINFHTRVFLQMLGIYVNKIAASILSIVCKGKQETTSSSIKAHTGTASEIKKPQYWLIKAQAKCICFHATTGLFVASISWKR